MNNLYKLNYRSDYHALPFIRGHSPRKCAHLNQIQSSDSDKQLLYYEYNGATCIWFIYIYTLFYGR